MRIFLFIFVALAQYAFGASVFYVDPVNGNDANNGTSTGTAWKTIPGTRTTNDSGFYSAAWGAINTTDRITDNTTINLRPLYVYSGTNGGYIQMSPSAGNYYISGCTNIVIQADQTWGTGRAVLTGVGCDASVACFRVQVDGVTLRNLDIRNWVTEGIQFKEHPGAGDPLTNGTVDGCYLFNNCKTNLNDVDGAGSGQLAFRHAINVLVTNSIFNGNNVFVSGVFFGNTHQTVSGLVVDCISTNHQGDITDNDSGIGYKSLNSSITFRRCTGAWNLKGWDLGEESSDVEFTNMVISCTSSNNYWGINFNSVGNPSTKNGIAFYLINSYVVSNAFKGVHTYAPPLTVAVVHNLFDNNGQAGGPYDGSQLSITPETSSDTNVLVAYSYNNIFQNSYINVLEVNASHPTNRFTWLSDYNSYKQNSTERFCLWSLSYGPTQIFFDFGANGPGHDSGFWYTYYLNDTTAPLYGTGHFHSDSHSTGTGADDTSTAQLDGYELANEAPGLNLSGQSWYIAEMGFNRDGTVRSAWDKGPQDSDPTKILRRGPQKVRGLRLFK